MSDDLVKRLRATTDGATVNPDGPEAADRIAELEAVLERIIENEDQFRMAWAAEIARAALEGGKKDE